MTRDANMAVSRHLLFTVVGFLLFTACASYEDQKKIETVVQQSVDRFHEQLNAEHYHEIYSSADASLQQRVDENVFTSQLKSAREQLGRISGTSIVLLTSDQHQDLGWSKTFGGRLTLTHTERPNSELIRATEKSSWVIENDQPKLSAYEFRFICRQPCTVGIGIQ